MIPRIGKGEDGLYHAWFDEHPKRFRDRSLPRLVARVERWLVEFENVELEEAS